MSISLESIDCIMPSSLPPSTDIYPLRCFFDVNLSDLYVPRHLLQSTQLDSQPLKFKRSEFHTLHSANAFQSIAGFSSYTDAEEDEIFESDSDNEIFHSDAAVVDCVASNNLSNPQSSNLISEVPSQNIQNGTNMHCNVEQRNCRNLDIENDSSYAIASKAEIQKNDNFTLVPSNAQNSSPNAQSGSFCKYNGIISKPDKQKLAINFNPSDETSRDKIPMPKVEEYAKCNGFSFRPFEEHNGKEPDNAVKSASQTSLTEILDTTPEINLKDFPISYKKKDLAEINGECSKDRRNRDKRQKKKKKVAKYIKIHDSGVQENGQIFLDDSLADERAQDFILSVINARQSGATDFLPIHSPSEFPGLDQNEAGVKFVKSNKPPTCEHSNMNMRKVAELFSKNYEEEESSTSELDEDEGKKKVDDSKSLKKVVIENILKNVSEDEIRSVVTEIFGQIQSLTCSIDGDYQKAVIELEPDIENLDWSIECMNDTDPFGSSTKHVKCYSL